jgi:hypothetical protein
VPSNEPTLRSRHTTTRRQRGRSSRSAFGAGREKFFAFGVSLVVSRQSSDDLFAEDPQLPPDLIATLDEIDDWLSALLNKVTRPWSWL